MTFMVLCGLFLVFDAAVTVILCRQYRREGYAQGFKEVTELWINAVFEDELARALREHDGRVPAGTPRKAVDGDIYPMEGCSRCPWDIGDIHARDCAFPDCSPKWKPAWMGMDLAAGVDCTVRVRVT